MAGIVGDLFLKLYIVILVSGKLALRGSYSCSDGKEMYKKACCTSRIVVLPIQTIAFLTFSLSSPSWHLKVPYIIA